MILTALILSLATGCEKWPEQEKYKKPDWLPGKLYTTVTVQSNLTMFAECIRRTELDKILDVSGSWTVFAPTDEAMKQYLLENQYANISDIPMDELERITEFHIIQNPWTYDQLQSLGINGWKTGNDDKSNPYAFKRETISRNPNEKYWTKRVKKREVIVMDSIDSDRSRKVYVPSRKYVPLFCDEYFTKSGLTPEDFRFYFNRTYEPGSVFYADAKVIKADIFAENGFVHIVDKVVKPMLNAKELLHEEISGATYHLFMEMVYWYFPNFQLNSAATFNQPEVRRGGVADTLWDLNYAELSFDLHGEVIDNHSQTLMKHNGLFVPTDDAFNEFIDGTLTIKSGFPHWGNYKSLPMDIVKIIIAQNFKSSPLFPSSKPYKDVFSAGKRYRQKEESIIKKEFGSNCTFIGLDTYIPDRVFTSVSAPVFLRPNFSIFRRAMLYSGAIDAIATHAGKLHFFPISDYALTRDSSLVINWIDQDAEIFNFQVLNKSTLQLENVSSSTLRGWILNQVGTTSSGAGTGKETIRTLGGKYITWDHTNNTIRGTLPCTEGFQSNLIATCTPEPLDEPTDNGKSWGVHYWFNFK